MTQHGRRTQTPPQALAAMRISFSLLSSGLFFTAAFGFLSQGAPDSLRAPPVSEQLGAACEWELLHDKRHGLDWGVAGSIPVSCARPVGGERVLEYSYKFVSMTFPSRPVCGSPVLFCPFLFLGGVAGGARYWERLRYWWKPVRFRSPALGCASQNGFCIFFSFWVVWPYRSRFLARFSGFFLSCRKRERFASLAQLAEQEPFKLWVVGSSPTGGTKRTGVAPRFALWRCSNNPRWNRRGIRDCLP